MALQRSVLEKLIFEDELARRFTQDSPVMPDVWIAYGAEPESRLDLLLGPYREASPSHLAAVLRKLLPTRQRPPRRKGARHTIAPGGIELAFNQASVAAKLTLEELITCALPLSRWWKTHVSGLTRLDDAVFRKRLLQTFEAERRAGQEKVPPHETSGVRSELGPDTFWLVRILATIITGAGVRSTVGGDEPPAITATALVRAAQLLRVAREQAVRAESIELAEAPGRPTALLWSVNRNRTATAAVWRSGPAVKADAARQLFNIKCNELTWAVLDSGIDASHPAFRLRQPDGSLQPMWDRRHCLQSRVIATYDFTGIRDLLDAESDAKVVTPQQLRQRLLSGRPLDWSELLPLIELRHDGGYRRPDHPHGTHVAGILAGDWRSNDGEKCPEDQDLAGLCPDIRLYDLRVLKADGTGDEFSVMAAMQFVRYLNANRDRTIIHGVNLSLSIAHDVVNFACGRTPVCEEAERLVAEGTVVVAAAGNKGYLEYMSSGGMPETAYGSISITDPGNAEGVITVGATHRYRPHTYGVSYFSSRGPTGDGRPKPDLVAPGEKVKSCAPGATVLTLDGTSMAAPHVSGAAALLMARHRELVGEPRRVKKVLCSTATDLGRERYFQGGGMLDVLRALQAV